MSPSQSKVPDEVVRKYYFKVSMHPKKSTNLFALGAALSTLLFLPITTNAVSDGCSTADFKLGRTFEASTNNAFPGSAYAVGDLNGDGKPDIAETDSGAGTVIVMFNDGTGRPVISKAYAVGAGVGAVAAADLNGDGRPDLIVTNASSNNVSILLNLGGGLFGGATNFAAGLGPADISVADLNGDGKTDLVIAGSGSNANGRLSVLLGDGSGSFAYAPNSPIIIAGQANDAVVADFNSDGKLDVVLATLTSGYLELLGDGTGQLATPVQISNISGFGVATAEFDGDGKADLAISTFNGVGILKGNGSGGFSAPVITAHAGSMFPLRSFFRLNSNRRVISLSACIRPLTVMRPGHRLWAGRTSCPCPSYVTPNSFKTHSALGAM
jgi:FG-GAP-like repeat